MMPSSSCQAARIPLRRTRRWWNLSRKMQQPIRPLTPTLGAEIAGIDLCAALDSTEINKIRQALLDHQVLFFRDQKLTPEQQLRFSEYFGPVMIPTIDTISTAQPVPSGLISLS